MIDLLANVGGTLGLALFAILMLQRTWKQHEDQLTAERARRDEELVAAREDQRHLLAVIERNTATWSATAETMEALVAAVCENQRNLAGIRILLARRPCVKTGALDTGAVESQG